MHAVLHACACCSVIYLSVTYSSLKCGLNPADSLSQCKYVPSPNIGPAPPICMCTRSPASVCVLLIRLLLPAVPLLPAV